MHLAPRLLPGLLALLGLAACAATGGRAAPDLAPARVVYLTYVSADEAALALGGRSAWQGGAFAPGSLLVTAEPRDNALIIAAAAGHADDVERALEIVRLLDVPRMAVAGAAGR